MQARLACLLLLSVFSRVLCSDVSREQRTLAEELLRGLLAAQMKQKQSAPYWPTSLATLCTTLSNREEEEEEEYEEGVRKLMEENLQLLEEAYKQQNLQQLCGALLGWGERQLLQEHLEEKVEHPLKRKSPSILKRRTGRTSKSRRPYILKRRAVY